MDLRDVLSTISELDPDAPALWFRDRWWTWAEVNALGDDTLARIDKAGIGPDESIGLVFRNHVATVAVALAALRAGRPIMTFSPLLPDTALAADVLATQPAALVAIDADWERDGLVAALAGGLGLAVGTEVREVEGTAYEPAVDHHRAAAGTAATMLTSGTTGPSKRLAVTVASLAAAIDAATLHHEGKAADAKLVLRDTTSIIDLPMFNITSYLDLATIVAAGRRICLLERFDPNAWVDAVERHQVVVALLVPTAMKMVYDLDVPKERLRSLKVVRSGSAPLDPALAAAFEDRYGMPVIVAYGATEFSGALASLTMKDRRAFGNAKRGSVGRGHPGIELRIVDPADGHDLPADEVGLLEARGPQMAGSDWIRTNDLARIDRDGFLYIMGRIDDVIIRGGFKVDPAAVTAVMREHPAVLDVAVIGMPDERLGQVPAAAVVLAPGSGDVADELREMVRAQLAPYAVPVTVQTVDALPRTPTMKLARAELARMLAG